MQAITKGPEPTELAAYRAVPGATYDGKDFTPVKDKIRDALVRDQLALCCYCMRRISKETRPHPTTLAAPQRFLMKVEHWQAQTAAPTLQLAWKNMLGACPGGEGSPPASQHCDTRKGEATILLDPLDRAHVATLYCRSNGRLESTDPRFSSDIDEHLGLNTSVLVADRKVMLDRDLARLRRQYPTETFRTAPCDGSSRSWRRRRTESCVSIAASCGYGREGATGGEASGRIRPSRAVI